MLRGWWNWLCCRALRGEGLGLGFGRRTRRCVAIALGVADVLSVVLSCAGCWVLGVVRWSLCAACCGVWLAACGVGCVLCVGCCGGCVLCCGDGACCVLGVLFGMFSGSGPSGRVLTTLQRALDRTEMECYLPDEVVLIGCRHRTDSMQPERNSFSWKRKNMILTFDPFFIFRRTERPDQTARPNGHK